MKINLFLTTIIFIGIHCIPAWEAAKTQAALPAAEKNTVDQITKYSTNLKDLLNKLKMKSTLPSTVEVVGPRMVNSLRQLENINDQLLMGYSELPCLGQKSLTQLKDITTQVMKLIPVANSIDSLSGGLAVNGQGPFPKIVSGLNDITQKEATALQTLQSMPACTKPPTAATKDRIKKHNDAIIAAFTATLKAYGDIGGLK